jgi:methyl-accepting chemotaxis protein
MAGWFKNLKLQMKFMLVIGAGLFVLGALAVTAQGFIEYGSMQQRLRDVSERELNSLNSLVDSAMRARLNDPQDVAIKVFDAWFDSRNKEYNGKLWSVWGPKTQAYMAKTAPKVTPKAAHDDIDEEALRTGQPVGRFVGDTYRYSIPIVWGVAPVTKHESCGGCHASGIGEKNGDVVNVFSSSLNTIEERAAMRQHILFTALGALAAIALMLTVVWFIFGRVVARPVRRIANVLTELTNDRIVDVPYADRGDEIGYIAKATELFKQSIAEKVINLRVRSGLDVVKSNVMIADGDYNIIYMNTTLQEMMKEAESELRKVLPNFNANKLIGASMDVFHKNPAHQRRLLDSLAGVHESHITVGSQKFHLAAIPVIDANGKRAGTVVEWRNETIEKAIESEISDIAEAAVGGDFSKRIPLEGKKEFMLNLAKTMNSLCDNIAGVLEDLVRMFGALAGGDLTQRITADYQGNFAILKNNANTMAERIGATIAEIKASAAEVTNASAEISTSTTDLSQRTEEQAASLEETSASMEEIASTVKKNAEYAQAANQSASTTRDVADHGGQVVAQAVEAMAGIEESSRKISDIIGVIDEIARQTNLLALNAAVEAARAGEAGRGFAVVASEVRSLAQRSSQAAKDIKDLITNSNDQVKGGVDLVNRAGAALTEIVESIKKVADIVADIANASNEQSTGIEQVNKALTQMDEVTQQNSALVEENAATAKTLEHQAKAMDERVSFFKLDAAAGDRPVAKPAAQPVVARNPRPAAAPPSRKPAAVKQPAAPKQQPAAAPKRVAAATNAGGPVRRMQAALATAVNSEPDWKEF